MIKRLLILGSLGEFVQLVDMAKERGLETFVCDGYEEGPAKTHADHAYTMDVGDIESIAALCESEHIDAITTSFSDYLFECMVKIAAAANLPCYATPGQLPYYRDKYQMKNLLKELGIASPAYTVLSRDFTDDALNDFHFPVVVKPLDKYGSRGLKVLSSAKEIREHFDETCSSSNIKQILVEEYNGGHEFNMMTWVYDGVVHLISIADREKTPVGAGEIPISSRNVYPSRLMSYVEKDAMDILQKFATHLHQKDGPLSMQFFWNPTQGIQVCEIAGRFFGYEHELVAHAGGLCIEDLLLDYACGDQEAIRALFANHKPSFLRHAATLYFHGKEGMTIDNQETARRLAKEEGTLESCFFYEDGSTITHFGKEPYVARFYIAANTREDLDKKTDRIYRTMAITDAAGDNVLYENRIPDYEDCFS